MTTDFVLLGFQTCTTVSFPLC